MPVQYKFRGERAFRSLLNVTTPCTVHRVRTAIYEQARISDAQTDLVLEDGESGGPLDPQRLLAQEALVQIVVRRTPVHVRGAAAAGVAAEAPLRADEDRAIDSVVEQHDLGGAAGMSLSAAPGGAMLRYSRSYRVTVGSQQGKGQAGYDAPDVDQGDGDREVQREPPPANYTCHRCGQVGGREDSHWIWECPTNDDPDHMKKVRTAKGIPRDFLQKVSSVEEGQEKSAGGVTFTLPGHSGHYILSHEPTYEDQKRRVGDTVGEKVTCAFSDGARHLEGTLKCPLCRNIFRQAILAPCCGTTFCHDCVIDRIAYQSVDNSACPGCGKEVYAHQLVANEDIRRQVEQIARASKAVALATEKAQAQERPKLFEMDASLKDRVNRPKVYAAQVAAAGAAALASAPLALMNAPHADGEEPPAVVWQPLAFGLMLNEMQFEEWRRVVRTGIPHKAQAQNQLELWQAAMREAAPPPPPGAGPLPSKESFEEWQRMMRDAAPQWALMSHATERKRRRDHKDKKDKKAKRAQKELPKQEHHVKSEGPGGLVTPAPDARW